MARLLVVGLFALVSFGGLGCGDDEESTSTSTSASTTEATTTVDPARSENVNLDFGALPPDVAVDEREGAPPADGDAGDLEAAASTAGCDLQLALPDEGNQHFSDVAMEPAYETSPPTSGPHYFTPRENGAGALADGAFLDTPPANRVVHSLEHGRVAIQYSPELPEEDQLALKGLFDDDRPGIQLFPNPEVSGVAVTAWRQLLSCGSYEGDPTLGVIAAFRDEFRGKGPEPVIF